MGEDKTPPCPTCGEDGFSSLQYVRIHHTRVHDERIPETKECEICDDDFEILPSQRETRPTCSHGCKSKLYSEKEMLSGEENPAWVERIEKTCDWCEDTYEVLPSRTDRTRFCGRECRSEWRSVAVSGKNHYLWKEKVAVECEHCGGTIEVRPSKASSTRFCSRRCQADWRSENRSGANSPLWNGGVPDYYGKHWSRHRSIVKQHYQVCQICEDDETTSLLDVHHYTAYKRHDSNIVANRLDNLVLLCRECHKSVELGKEVCPKPDSAATVLRSLKAPCHPVCAVRAVRYAENPEKVIDVIEASARVQ